MAVKIFYLGKYFTELGMYFIGRIFDLMLRYLCGCDLQTRTKIGKGLELPHNGLGVVIHPKAIIGDNVKILQNVTIGGRKGSGLPIIEDDVLIGAGAVILGDVKLGKGCKVGANSVVLNDAPPIRQLWVCQGRL